MATQVDKDTEAAAQAKARAIEADTRAAIERAWCVDHPRVDPTRVHAVPVRDADYYLIEQDAATYRCKLLNDREVLMARCRREDHALLEEARPVRIPPVPAAPAPPTPLAHVLAARQPVTEALDLFRRTVHRWAQHVDVRRPDPLADLHAQYPGVTPSPFVGERDRPNTDGLRQLARIIAETASYHRVVPDLVVADRRLVDETTTAIQAARASLVTPALPSVLTAGEPPVQVARSGAERAGEATEDLVGKLQAALTTLAPIIQGLTAATPPFLRSALQVLREGHVAIVTLHIDIERERLQALRVLPFERDATRALADLAQAVPEIAWPSDLLGKPTVG